MPVKIVVDGNGNKGRIKYVYSADGIKLQKIKTVGGEPTITDYAGNFVYEDGDLKQISHAEGYVEQSGNTYQYVYYLKDHLGNTRVTFADVNGNGTIEKDLGEIKRTQNYYPYGLEHANQNKVIVGVKNNLKTYQGQEFTEDLGLNTHEWKYRMSDPSIGRFWQIDPLVEKYIWMTPYQFASNQPIHASELEGEENRLDLNLRLQVAEKIVNRDGGNLLDIQNELAKGEAFSNLPESSGAVIGNTIGGAISVVGQAIDINDTYDAFNGGSTADKVLAIVAWIPGLDFLKTIKKGTKAKKAKNITNNVKDRADLPALDSTGKVHGDLISPKDFSKYSADELKQLNKELKQSVQSRIKATNTKGKNATKMQNKTHGERQASEQDLIKSIEKYLEQ